MAKYENPAELDYRNGGDTVDDFAQKYMRTIAYVFKALNDLRTPTGNTAGVEPEPYMWRIADNKLYIRNGDNTDYVLLGEISPNFGFRQSVNDRFITTDDLEREGTVVVRDANNKVTGDITGSPDKIAGKLVEVTPTSTNDILAYDATQQAWVKKTLNDYLKKTDDPEYDDLVAEIVDQVITDITPVIFNYWRPDAGGYLTPLGSNVIAPQYGSTQNSVGASDRPWKEGYFDSVKLNGGDLGEYLAESTGYGIVSGCEPTISGLTVTVASGIVHLADGTRKEISATNITLDSADSTNPRIDLVYITSAGAVAKITGTAADSPSAPSVPTGGISVAHISVAANDSAGVVTDKRKMLNPCFFYDSVASMVADNVLRVGDVTRTLGYYAANDGGGAIYRIVDTTQFLSETLNNGLYAELIVEDTLNLKQIGAKSRDSSFNNSPILKKAIDYALSSKKYSTIYIPSGYYTFTTTIDLLSENKSLSVINLVGDGENWNGNASGTVISYYGASNTYLFDFGVVSRCLFKRLLFTGSGSNKCFSIKNCYVTRFEDVQLQDFSNAVWLREYCAYVYFDHCMFNCARNGTKGLILNTHYTDGREYTQQYNVEYIYITDCAFDAGDDLSNHVVVYGCHFLWISRCDFCNSADVSILIDTTGWKSNILDVFIDSMSFCRNKIATKIIKGTGQAGRIKINGSWTRTEQPTVDDRILVTEGDGNVYQLELSGRCASYNSATYGVDAINAHMINTIIGEYNGRANDNEQRWYLYAPSKVTPRVYKKVTPSVTVDGNKVTYDFSSFGTANRFLRVCGGGVIGGTNGQCMVAFDFIHCYGSKITGNTGANISNVTISGKAITVTCGYNPSTYIGDMNFYALYV